MDYKFILILAICLILYYIYHELEKVKVQVNELTESVKKINKEKKTVSFSKENKQNNDFIPLPIPNSKKPIVSNTQLPKVNNNTNIHLPKKVIDTSLSKLDSVTNIRNNNTMNLPINPKINKLEPDVKNMILIDDDLTTIESSKEKINFNDNNLSDTETPESYENNSHDLALYSNDNNETSLGMDDIIDKTEDIITLNTNDTINIINEVSDENNDTSKESLDDEINIIEETSNEKNDDSSDILLLEDSNENSSSSNELKKKNQKYIEKIDQNPNNDISESLNQILIDKEVITCTDSDKDETSENIEDLEVNIDLDEIVNESSNNKLKMKTLKRKKLAELQKIASEYGISLNKVKEGKLKNKTKNELCKDIVSKQY